MSDDSVIPAREDFVFKCTGDACAGDTVLFKEAVFTGSIRNPKLQGYREVAAEIIKDSYGAAKQQHTFTLLVLWCVGVAPLRVGQRIHRKGRVMYRHGTHRLPWADEQQRTQARAEKHARGDVARQARQERRAADRAEQTDEEPENGFDNDYYSGYR